MAKLDINIVDEEFSQAKSRVIMNVIVTLILLISLYFETIPVIALHVEIVHTLFTIAWLIFVKNTPNKFPDRRYIPIFSDMFIISLGLYLMGSYGALVFPVYLWVIVSNGMRFGQRFLTFSAAIGIFGFVIVLLTTDHWLKDDNIPTGIGLLIGLIILPLFYTTLIKRLHSLNEKLVEELKKSTYAATHDAMTGLYNRGYFMDRLSQEIQRTQRYKQSFVVVYIDLDNFKIINDTYGHDSGDKVIITISERLQQIIRKTDIVGRLGGDEFGLILISMKNMQDIEIFCHKLTKALSDNIIISGVSYTSTVSIGVSKCPDSGATVEDMIKSADKAMYLAKKSGKNTFSLCHDDFIDGSDKPTT